MPGVDEIVVKKISAVTLEKDKKAVHLEAKKTFIDQFKKERKAGEQWMLTNEDCQTYIPDVFEEVKYFPSAIVLKANNYCVVEDYVDEGNITGG